MIIKPPTVATSQMEELVDGGISEKLKGVLLRMNAAENIDSLVSEKSSFAWLLSKKLEAGRSGDSPLSVRLKERLAILNNIFAARKNFMIDMKRSRATSSAPQIPFPSKLGSAHIAGSFPFVLALYISLVPLVQTCRIELSSDAAPLILLELRRYLTDHISEGWINLLRSLWNPLLDLAGQQSRTNSSVSVATLQCVVSQIVAFLVVFKTSFQSSMLHAPASGSSGVPPVMPVAVLVDLCTVVLLPVLRGSTAIHRQVFITLVTAIVDMKHDATSSPSDVSNFFGTFCSPERIDGSESGKKQLKPMVDWLLTELSTSQNRSESSDVISSLLLMLAIELRDHTLVLRILSDECLPSSDASDDGLGSKIARFLKEWDVATSSPELLKCAMESVGSVGSSVQVTSAAFDGTYVYLSSRSEPSAEPLIVKMGSGFAGTDVNKIYTSSPLVFDVSGDTIGGDDADSSRSQVVDLTCVGRSIYALYRESIYRVEEKPQGFVTSRIGSVGPYRMVLSTLDASSPDPLGFDSKFGNAENEPAAVYQPRLIGDEVNERLFVAGLIKIEHSFQFVVDEFSLAPSFSHARRVQLSQVAHLGMSFEKGSFELKSAQGLSVDGNPNAPPTAAPYSASKFVDEPTMNVVALTAMLEYQSSSFEELRAQHYGKYSPNETAASCNILKTGQFSIYARDYLLGFQGVEGLPTGASISSCHASSSSGTLVTVFSLLTGEVVADAVVPHSVVDWGLACGASFHLKDSIARHVLSLPRVQFTKIQDRFFGSISVAVLEKLVALVSEDGGYYSSDPVEGLALTFGMARRFLDGDSTSLLLSSLRFMKCLIVKCDNQPGTYSRPDGLFDSVKEFLLPLVRSSSNRLVSKEAAELLAVGKQLFDLSPASFEEDTTDRSSANDSQALLREMLLEDVFYSSRILEEPEEEGTTADSKALLTRLMQSHFDSRIRLIREFPDHIPVSIFEDDEEKSTESLLLIDFLEELLCNVRAWVLDSLEDPGTTGENSNVMDLLDWIFPIVLDRSNALLDAVAEQGSSASRLAVLRSGLSPILPFLTGLSGLRIEYAGFIEKNLARIINFTRSLHEFVRGVPDVTNFEDAYSSTRKPAVPVLPNPPRWLHSIMLAQSGTDLESPPPNIAVPIDASAIAPVDLASIPWLLDLSVTCSALVATYCQILIVGNKIDDDEKSHGNWLSSDLLRGGIEKSTKSAGDRTARFIADLIENKQGSDAVALLAFMRENVSKKAILRGGEQIDLAERYVIAAMLKHGNLIEKAVNYSQYLNKRASAGGASSEPSSSGGSNNNNAALPSSIPPALKHVWNQASKVRIHIVQMDQMAASESGTVDRVISKAKFLLHSIAPSISSSSSSSPSVSPAGSSDTFQVPSSSTPSPPSNADVPSRQRLAVSMFNESDAPSSSSLRSSISRTNSQRENLMATEKRGSIGKLARAQSSINFSKNSAELDLKRSNQENLKNAYHIWKSFRTRSIAEHLDLQVNIHRSVLRVCSSVINFVQSEGPLEPLPDLLETHAARAEMRAEGMASFITLIKISSPCIFDDLLHALFSSLRSIPSPAHPIDSRPTFLLPSSSSSPIQPATSMPLYHFLENVSACGVARKVKLQAAFNNALVFITSQLSALATSPSASTYSTVSLILEGVARIKFTEAEHDLLYQQHIFPTLKLVMRGDAAASRTAGVSWRKNLADSAGALFRLLALQVMHYEAAEGEPSSSLSELQKSLLDITFSEFQRNADAMVGCGEEGGSGFEDESGRTITQCGDYLFHEIRCYTSLSLLLMVSTHPQFAGYFATSRIVEDVLSVFVKQGACSPRVKQLILRLLVEILPHLKPAGTIVDLLFSHLGDLLLPSCASNDESLMSTDKIASAVRDFIRNDTSRKLLGPFPNPPSLVSGISPPVTSGTSSTEIPSFSFNSVPSATTVPPSGSLFSFNTAPSAAPATSPSASPFSFNPAPTTAPASAPATSPSASPFSFNPAPTFPPAPAPSPASSSTSLFSFNPTLAPSSTPAPASSTNPFSFNTVPPPPASASAPPTSASPFSFNPTRAPAAVPTAAFGVPAAPSSAFSSFSFSSNPALTPASPSASTETPSATTTTTTTAPAFSPHNFNFSSTATTTTIPATTAILPLSPSSASSTSTSNRPSRRVVPVRSGIASNASASSPSTSTANLGAVPALLPTIHHNWTSPVPRLEGLRMWESGAVKQGFGADLVTLLRILWSNPTWACKLSDHVKQVLFSFSKAANRQEAIGQARDVVAALSVIGGFEEGKWVGSKVELVGNERTGLLVSISGGIATMIVDGASAAASNVQFVTNLEPLTAIPDVPFNASLFPMTFDLMPAFASLLKLDIDSSLSLSQVRAAALKSLSVLLQSPVSCSQFYSGGLLPALLGLTRSPSASSTKGNRNIANIQQFLCGLHDLVGAFWIDHLPNNPFAYLPANLPTKFNAEDIRVTAAKQLFLSNVPVEAASSVSKLPGFYFEVRIDSFGAISADSSIELGYAQKRSPSSDLEVLGSTTIQPTDFEQCIIGCGWDRESDSYYFTKNSQITPPDGEMLSSRRDESTSLFAFLRVSGTCAPIIRPNFGQHRFAFNFSKHIAAVMGIQVDENRSPIDSAPTPTPASLPFPGTLVAGDRVNWEGITGSVRALVPSDDSKEKLLVQFYDPELALKRSIWLAASQIIPSSSASLSLPRLFTPRPQLLDSACHAISSVSTSYARAAVMALVSHSSSLRPSSDFGGTPSFVNFILLTLCDCWQDGMTAESAKTNAPNNSRSVLTNLEQILVDSLKSEALQGEDCPLAKALLEICLSNSTKKPENPSDSIPLNAGQLFWVLRLVYRHAHAAVQRSYSRETFDQLMTLCLATAGFSDDFVEFIDVESGNSKSPNAFKRLRLLQLAINILWVVPLDQSDLVGDSGDVASPSFVNYAAWMVKQLNKTWSRNQSQADWSRNQSKADTEFFIVLTDLLVVLLKRGVVSKATLGKERIGFVDKLLVMHDYADCLLSERDSPLPSSVAWKAYKVSLAVVRESPHPIPKEFSSGGFIEIPGAMGLDIIVDKSSKFSNDCRLAFFVNEEDANQPEIDESKAIQCLKHDSVRGTSFTVPVGGIHFKYLGAMPEDDDWGYRFAVLPKFVSKDGEEIHALTEHSSKVQKFASNYGRDLRLDAQLVQYGEHQASSKEMDTPLELLATGLNPTSYDFQTFPLLSTVPLEDLQFRFAVLQVFNRLITPFMPFIVGGKGQEESASLVRSVYKLRGLVFSSTKKKFMEQHFAQPGRGRAPTIQLNRLMPAPTSEEDAVSQTLFVQAYHQARVEQAGSYLHVEVNDRPWQVKLIGEGATDAGGPYYDTLSKMIAEVQSPPLSLFIACPNAQLASEQEGLARARDRILPNPSRGKSGPIGEMAMYEFIGNMMGVAIRSANPLSLPMAGLVWSQLVGNSPTLPDLVDVDQFCGQCLNGLRRAEENGITADNFGSIFFETFTTTLSDGSQIELVPNGSAIPVTFENRLEYADLVEKARLFESSAQIQSIRRGLCEAVPAPLIDLLTAEELEHLVCGRPTIDASQLRSKHCRYDGYTDSSEVINIFWSVFEGFTHPERSLLLRFACGRDRLPTNNPEFKLVIARLFPDNDDDDSVETLLPRASTCSSMFKLPPYTNRDIMRDKILLAITSCGEIDNDFLVRS